MSPRLRELLLGAGIRFDVIAHPPAYTAQQRAASAHVGGRHVVKVVMVRGGDDWFGMAALPAPARLDLSALASITGRTSLRLATEDEFAHLFPECEPGAMPPFGHLYGIDLVLDRSLMDADEIVFPAGRHEEEVRMSMRDYVALARPTVAAISMVSRAA